MDKKYIPFTGAFVFLLSLLCLSGCSSSDHPDNPGDITPINSDYVVFSWNDLGMHCLNPTYDQAVILPPYNTVWAQVIERGNPPKIVTSGLTVEYRIVGNTYSSGKTDSYGGHFSQFWDNAFDLFGVNLEVDTGLNLDTPSLHNGLSGQMVQKGDHFQVDGIPVVPVGDDGTWNPYQVAEITVLSGSTTVAQTRNTVPTSDEINCAKCHSLDGPNVFLNVLTAHDDEHSTTLVADAPVLCASCHGSPALGQSGPGSSGKYLSEAIHHAHASRGAVCIDCHPGATTKCNRSLAHTAEDGNCTTCHGTMAEVAQSVADGTRIPWAQEPECVTCHSDVPEVATGNTLYRHATGHGDVYCAACHGSPHAMVPSREDSDNYQPLQYQNSTKTIGSCGACHRNSKGNGSGEFAGEHGGSGENPSACNVCHTAIASASDITKWPHKFGWHAR